MTLKRSIQFVVLLIALLLPVVVQAQAPTPAPSPVRSLSDNISALSQRAAGLLPYFDREIVSKLMGWFELLAWVLGNCLAGFAMLRVIREEMARVQVFTGGLADLLSSSCSQEQAWRLSIR